MTLMRRYESHVRAGELLSPVYTIQPVVKPVSQPVLSCIQTFIRQPFWQPAVSCKRGIMFIITLTRVQERIII